MSDLIDLFKSHKIDETKLVGNNNFFHTSSELQGIAKHQNRFISDINYSNPTEFARFGSAEEYYKTAINYINFDYPLDGTSEKKINWINGLTDFEYYIFNKEYPKQCHYLQLSGSQQLKVSALRTLTSSVDPITSFVSKNGNNFVNYIDLEEDGFTYETWFKNQTGSIGNDYVNLLTLNGIKSVAGTFYDVVLMKIMHTGSHFVVSGSDTSSSFSYSVPKNSWEHYAFKIKKDNISLFVNGKLKEQKTTSNLTTPYKYRILSKCFVEDTAVASASLETFGDKNPIVIGDNTTATGSFDETRLWIGAREIEQIGRNWFIGVDGNDFSATSTNNNLLAYYKYNEEFKNYESLVIDYSGYDNHAIILNKSSSVCQITGSAITLSGLTPDSEIAIPIIAPTISSSATLWNFYQTKISGGMDYDSLNGNALYKKFPSWMLDEESDNDVKHLKQIVQIISVYFDDLYNKISEISKLKHINNTKDNQSIYPFYDTILSSTGFDVQELFNNLNVVENLLSRQEQNIFDLDTQKVKNYIFQNIYNNLIFILKSKGTEKSIRSFLRSYGVNENLIRINLYADKSGYKLQEKSISTTVKKKILSLYNNEIVYMSGSNLTFSSQSNWQHRLSLESCFTLPVTYNTISKDSLFGVVCSDGTTKIDINVGCSSSQSGYRFYVSSGSYTNYLVTSSLYYPDIFDNTVWNLCLKIYPKVDDIKTALGYDYSIELFGTNQNSSNTKQFNISASVAATPLFDYNAEFVPYVGAAITDFTGSLQVPTAQKSLYFNVWGDYLDNDVIVAHNKDILNYGFE